MEGNKMKMREALARIALRFSVDGLGRHWIRLNEHDLQLIQSALSEPARQCDVGTPEEQIQRFNDFCDEHYNLHYGESECGNCPLWTSGLCGSDCQLRWAQMPYKAEEGGAE